MITVVERPKEAELSLKRACAPCNCSCGRKELRATPTALRPDCVRPRWALHVGQWRKREEVLQ